MRQSRWVGKVWGPLLGAALLASLSTSAAGASGASPATSAGQQSVMLVSASRHITALPAGSSKAVITPDGKGVAVLDGAAHAVNRSLSHRPGALSGPAASALAVPAPTPTAVSTTSGAVKSFTGITDYQQRYVASGGNQFTVTPPDQGLCVGNGFVVETVNDTIRTFDTLGNALTNPIGLNAFYGYPYEINRTTGIRGPFPTDPNCYYDPQYSRWFHVVLTLEVVPTTGALTGKNHLDIAVSVTSNPLNGWVFYHIPVQDDGTQGTPKHASCPCIGDFPHIGADQNGFYITTNEYPFVGAGKYKNGYNGAQIYAISKLALAQNALTVKVVHISSPTLGSTPSFTMWPNEVPGTAYDTNNSGTEWFLQSTATLETLNTTGMSNTIGVWSLTNTASLATAKPSLTLASKALTSEVYGIPPVSEQKVGPVPLRDCLLTGCIAGIGPSPSEVESGFDSSDSRMLTSWLAGGKLYGALGTIVNVNGRYQAGVAFFAIKTATTIASVTIANQGYVAVAGNISYPSIATLANGTGAMAFTLVGASWYPSAAYMTFAASGPVGSVIAAKVGAGPDDEFCGYLFFNCGNTTPSPSIRPRWGDYGAAAVDGTSVWIASEFIDQTCSITTWMADQTCGGTRAQIGNWATRITRVS
ncbi:MAG: hypothetical protein M3082_02390 [Candidatus Dormibacteraeota bacterium]|nr:hypothetical protein [Candidatus Dormibacteraeota bacterium]